MSECNNGKGGEGSVKPYVIIKGGSASPYGPLQKGGEGGLKSEKLPYVIYEQSLKYI